MLLHILLQSKRSFHQTSLYLLSGNSQRSEVPTGNWKYSKTTDRYIKVFPLKKCDFFLKEIHPRAAIKFILTFERNIARNVANLKYIFTWIVKYVRSYCISRLLRASTKINVKFPTTFATSCGIDRLLPFCLLSIQRLPRFTSSLTSLLFPNYRPARFLFKRQRFV